MREQRTNQPARERQARTASERSQQARRAAQVMHSKHDARRTTAKARQAFLARFEREVDPEGVLDPAERARRADHARSAYFAGLRLRAVRARRDRAAGRVARPGRGDAS